MRRTTLSAAVAVLALSLSALAAPAHAASTPGFYDPPGQLPAANGDLVKTEPMKVFAQVRSISGTRSLPGTATRLMYRSTDAAGAPVAVTGAYLEPAVRWTGGGERPLVVLAAGTQGQGDSCAPTKTLESLITIDEQQIGVGYEVPNIYAFLARGVAVVVTDYVGLGTTDRVHSYGVRLDLGHAVLDAARAASKVSGASVTATSPVGLFGYSQGGGAVASAAELASSYAPELNLKGTYAGAPPADLFGVLKTADGGLTAAVGYAFNGILSYYPEAKAALDAELNDTGHAALDTLSRSCIIDATGNFLGRKTSQWTTSGESFSQLAARIPAAQQAIADQRIGLGTPNAPVQVLTGTKDDVVEHAQAKQLAADWCAKGVSVTYVPVVQLTATTPPLNHLTPAVTRALPAQQWLIDRLRSVPTGGNCGQLGWLP